MNNGKWVQNWGNIGLKCKFMMLFLKYLWKWGLQVRKFGGKCGIFAKWAYNRIAKGLCFECYKFLFLNHL